MDDLTLRNAEPGDIDAMWALDQTCFAPHFQFNRRAMRRFANAPGAIALIAESAGHIAGFCIVQIEAATAYVVTVDIDAPYRRTGLARRLIAEAETRSHAASASTIELHVHTENTAAIGLYEALGYTQTETAPGFYGHGRHALLYRKRLAP